MIVPAQALNLVERFNCNCDSCRSLQYNEAQPRWEFGDPQIVEDSGER